MKLKILIVAVVFLMACVAILESRRKSTVTNPASTNTALVSLSAYTA
ncbi:hypothetical protein [Mucilaginibacter paludis]|nr:hypothetical protein [Mucilaginibacter paludis]